MSGAPRVVDYSLKAEGIGDHLRNAAMMLGGLRRALVATGLNGPDAEALIEGISRRIGLALEQWEQRIPATWARPEGFVGPCPGCGSLTCPGFYKPDGNHALAF